MRMVRAPIPRGSATELWLELRPTDAEAASLADEPRALFHRFETIACQSPQRSRRRYLLHGAIAGG
jgi:hypothetical protein